MMKSWPSIAARARRVLLTHFPFQCIALLTAVAFIAVPLEAQRQEVPILLYGQVGQDGGSQWRVTTQNFEQHMQTLDNEGFETITLEQYVNHINNPQGNPLPNKPIILTFINGYRSWLQTVDPILASHGFNATGFLVTGVIAETAGARQDSSWDTGDPGPDVDHLIWPEVQQLVNNGRWEIGSHTRTHARLTETSANDRKAEIEGSQDDIQSRLGSSHGRFFSYPFGAHNQTIRNEVAVHYDAAVGVQGVGQTSHDDLYALPRLYVLNPHGGDIMARLEGEPHPADTDDDWEVEDDELTSYISQWLGGADIPDDFLTQSIVIWLSGGPYTFNPEFDDARRWAPGE